MTMRISGARNIGGFGRACIQFRQWRTEGRTGEGHSPPETGDGDMIERGKEGRARKVEIPRPRVFRVRIAQAPDYLVSHGWGRGWGQWGGGARRAKIANFVPCRSEALALSPKSPRCGTPRASPTRKILGVSFRRDGSRAESSFGGRAGERARRII